MAAENLLKTTEMRANVLFSDTMISLFWLSCLVILLNVLLIRIINIAENFFHTSRKSLNISIDQLNINS